MFGWLRRKSGSKPVSREVKLGRRPSYVEQVPQTTTQIRAEYDAAQTTTDNSRHWANADSLSADAANSRSVREALRNRARYECQENNSYGKGIVLTLANDTIGTGPRLQMLTSNRSANQRIERAFAQWSRKIRLAQKLRTMRLAKAVDGESFAQFFNNSRLDGVQLDLALIECDQIATPNYTGFETDNQIDGIRFDSYGNPTVYHRLIDHPGDVFRRTTTEKVDVPASEMIHMFRMDRPGQHRGIPEVTTALPLFAQLRRFTLATLFAAETAANLSGVMHTEGPAIAEPDDVDAMDAIELERNAMLTLPRGWNIKQMRAEHPATTHEMFVHTILNEIARCLNVPFHIAAGNASGYNFASSRMDLQTYGVSIDVERSEWEVCCLDRILSAWFDEAILLPGLIPEGLGPFAELPHRWHWDGRPHVDPQKEANAQKTRLANGTTTFALEYAAQGLDYEDQMQSQADALGMSLDEYRAVLVRSIFGTEPQQEAMDEQEQPEAA